MKDLLEFLEGFAPGYSAEVRGAPAGALERLEALVSRRLPGAQAEFLRELGGAPGRLQPPRLDFTAEGLIAHYQEGEDLPPARYVLAAVDQDDPYTHLYIDAADPEAADGPVLWTGDASQLASTPPSYPSFREMLFAMAFQFVRLPQLSKPVFLEPVLRDDGSGRKAPPADTLERLGRAAAGLGLRRLPQTSDLNPLYERGDAALIAHQTPHGRGVAIHLAAQDERELRRLSEVLRDAVELI